MESFHKLQQYSVFKVPNLRKGLLFYPFDTLIIIYNRIPVFFQSAGMRGFMKEVRKEHQHFL